MKAKLSKIAGTFIVVIFLCMVSLAYATTPSELKPANSMWVEPSTVDLTNGTYPVGYRFNVTVWIHLNTTCGAWQFKMLYSRAHLNATGCWYTRPDLGKSDFFNNLTATMPLTPMFDAYNTTHNYILHGESWLMGSLRNPGYGSLSWVEFSVAATPPPGEIWTSYLDISTAYPADTKALTRNDTTMVKLSFEPQNSVYIVPEFPPSLIPSTLVTLTIIIVVATKLRKPKDLQRTNN